MSRRLIAWLVTLPLAVAGTQAAHALAYRLVTSADDERAHQLTTTGHGYLAYLPLVLAVGTVLVVLALAAEVRQIVHSHESSGPRLPRWHFALVAPAIFSCQEHFERLLHDGVFPWDAALAPTFLAGLLLQVPFAFVAYALARVLLHAACSLGRVFARRPARLRGATITWSATGFIAPRRRELALGYSSRGPPVASR